MSEVALTTDDTHIGPVQFLHNPFDKTTEVWKRESLAYWAKEPNGTLVLFIHGWTGRALDTWTDFIGLWPEAHRRCDLLFYGYSSARPQIPSNAAALTGFLERFMKHPAAMICDTIPHLPALHRSPQYEVNKLLIVAHSLGAVIARDALLMIKESAENRPRWAQIEKEISELSGEQMVSYLLVGPGTSTPPASLDPLNHHWLRRTKLILFAPAHCGSKLADLWHARALARGVALWALQSLRDLTPKCDYLVALQKRTEAVVKEGWREPFQTSQIVFPYVDDVVVNGRFPDDPPENEPFYGKTHSTVCKPSREWCHPITVLDRVLSQWIA